MEALLATVGMVAVMVVALGLVAIWWPRSSPFGGYRARTRGTTDAEPPVPEDDDAHWNWVDDPAEPDRPHHEETGGR